MLNLPTEVVSSEFMTMESKQLSTSRGHVILVGDMLARYSADALRYYICAAGPETSDADFTWADFVLRNNSELVAGWGNLVNRTATMLAKSFGEIPAAGPLEQVDEDVLAVVRAGFDTVGDLLGRQRLRNAIAEAMRVVGEVNKYLTVTEPYKMKDESQRERLGTVLHVAAQCVADCNTLLAPFLPHSSNKVHLALGGEGEFMPMPRIETVEELDPDNGAGLELLPDHHRRLRGHAPVGVGPGHGRRHRREADADLHQARPLGRRRGTGQAGLMAVALLGDRSSHRSHRELDALRRLLPLATEWVPTDSGFDVSAYDGVWLVPGSPYADDAAVLSALTEVRTSGLPFLGTCGGMQYAVLEFLRSVLGRAGHARRDRRRRPGQRGGAAGVLAAGGGAAGDPGGREPVRVVGLRAVRGDALLLLRADGRRGRPARRGRRGGRRDRARRRAPRCWSSPTTRSTSPRCSSRTSAAGCTR